MKYMILNDLNYIIKTKYKLILGYLSVFILYFFIGKDMFVGELEDMFINHIFGFKVYLKEILVNVLDACFILLNYALYIYITILIFVNDLDNFDNLFPRITLKKWLTIKIFNQFLICLIINTLLFLVIYFANGISGLEYITVLKKVCLLTIVTVGIYTIMLFRNKNRFIFYGLLISTMSIIFIPIDIKTISNLNLFMMFVIAVMMMYIISSYIKFSDLKE